MREQNEYLKRSDEESRLERTAEQVMLQTMMASLMSGKGS
jgi:hypothetical protein